MRFLRAAKALFFLPVGFVAADTTYNRAAISRSLATSDTACASEVDACNADDSCIDCFNVFVDSIDACQSSLSASCDDAQDAFCCALAEEDEDCENSFTFGNLIECVFDDTSPTCAGDVDISDCIGGDTGGVTTDSEDTTGGTTSDTACASELDACNADDSCIECFNVLVDGFDACQGTSTSLTCDDAQSDYCCALAGEDEDCENSFTFGNLLECAFTESNPTCSAGDLDISDCIGGNSDDGITDDEPTTGDSSSSADDPGDTDDNNDTDRTITTAAASRARSWGLSSVVSSTAVASLLVVFGAVV